MKIDPKQLVVHLPDTRGVTISPFGKGNMKIGLGVYTYSKLPGLPTAPALGLDPDGIWGLPELSAHGTCPGATPECLSICYAARPVAEHGSVSAMWLDNSRRGAAVPPIPEDAKLLRVHVAGDFDSYDYIVNWIARMVERPDVTMWAYTRSWRVPTLLPALEALRKLHNVQLFASVDKSVEDLPPTGWRRAWIAGDARENHWDTRSDYTSPDNHVTFDKTPSYVCPEQTGRRRDCVQCGYCLKGQRGDVTFLQH